MFWIEAGLVVAFFIFGFYLGHNHRAETADAKLKAKLAELADELDAIEAQADRRIVPEILKVTARVKKLI